MHKVLGKKAAIAGAIAAFAIAMTAGVAFAGAPVLQPGVTSAPNMSGTCTDCHTYAAAATTTPKPKAKAKAKKPIAVSHPYVSKRRHHVGVAFSVWGFVSPRIPNANEATLTIRVQRFVGHGSWVATSGLDATGTVSQSGKFKHKTNYATMITVGQAGQYRMRAKLVWLDAKGVEHTKWSKLGYFRVFK